MAQALVNETELDFEIVFFKNDDLLRIFSGAMYSKSGYTLQMEVEEIGMFVSWAAPKVRNTEWVGGIPINRNITWWGSLSGPHVLYRQPLMWIFGVL